MSDSTKDAKLIEKLYEFGQRLDESKDKSQNVKDYQGIIDARTTSVKAKELAAQLILRFFKFFPDLSGRSFDNLVDLIEEEELGIRVQVIRGLPLFCKERPEYLFKIVDILVQLLNVDETEELDAVHEALMSLLRQDVKASLTALFKYIVSPDSPEEYCGDEVRENVIGFVRDKVFPIKDELLRPQEEMERHITGLIKQGLKDVNGAEFKMFMDFLRSLSIFGDKAGQADLHAQFDLTKQ